MSQGRGGRLTSQWAVVRGGRMHAPALPSMQQDAAAKLAALLHS